MGMDVWGLYRGAIRRCEGQRGKGILVGLVERGGDGEGGQGTQVHSGGIGAHGHNVARRVEGQGPHRLGSGKDGGWGGYGVWEVQESSVMKEEMGPGSER